jgi:hypothetical protein
MNQNPSDIASTNQISVAATATLIIAANAARKGVLVTNPSTSVTVYLGLSGVTTGTGGILPPLSSVFLPITGAVYGIVASSTQTVSFMEIN